MAGFWPFSFLFGEFMDWDGVEVHTHAKKKTHLGQYPRTILIIMWVRKSFKKGAGNYPNFVDEVRKLSADWFYALPRLVEIIRYITIPGAQAVVCPSVDTVVVARIFASPTFAIELNSEAFVSLEMKIKTKQLNTEGSRQKTRRLVNLH